MSEVAYALRGEEIVKRFGAVTALDGVSLTLKQGEILGVLGDNGAGKSTLIKILTGFHQQTSGKLFIGGEETMLRSVDHARSLGIECVYQDLALANSLSIYHNMFLNREIIHPGPFRLLNNRAMRTRAAEFRRIHRHRCFPGSHGPMIKRCIIRQRPVRDISHQLAMVPNAQPRLRLNRAHNHRIQSPLREDAQHLIFTTLLGHQQHPLLALREHDLVGAHSGLALRNAIQLHIQSHAAAPAHLAG